MLKKGRIQIEIEVCEVEEKETPNKFYSQLSPEFSDSELQRQEWQNIEQIELELHFL